MGALALFNKLGLSRSLWIFPWQQPVGNRRYRGISLDPSMAATGGEQERQGDHFGSESLVDSSRRADPGGIEGRRCSRGRKGGRLVQEGGRSAMDAFPFRHM